MAASDGAAPAAPTGHRDRPGTGASGWVKPTAAAAVLGAVFLWFFPLFRVVPLKSAGAASADRAAATAGTTGATPGPSSAATRGAPAASAAFDPVAAAAAFWRSDLPAAHARAADLAAVAAAVRANAEAARTRFAHAAGLGTPYYFVRGSAKVVAREKNVVRLAPVGADGELFVVRLGPVFGNTVRDGTGLLDVNSFPGLQEFNALSAELNALVEKTVLPALRDHAVVGATIHFVGCAEAPESAPDAGEPLFTLVPVHAEVR
jgi:predicted lipoprotein